MIVLKDAAALARMRDAGRIAAEVRDALALQVVEGVTTLDLAAAAGAMIRDRGAKSAFLGYRGYPAQICISVNEEVVHGIPSARRLQSGDLVSLDIGVEYAGYIGDTAITVPVGCVSPLALNLLETTKAALAAGLKNAVAGARLSDVSHAIQTTAEAAGCSVVRDFVGHGIGHRLHEPPEIPNFGPPGKGPVLKAGMTLAIEPMVNSGTERVKVLSDKWTVVSADGSYSAHFEHTVAVRNVGEPEILTLGTLF